MQLTDAKREEVGKWLRKHHCCFRIVGELMRGDPNEVMGCLGGCPLTGQNGKPRNQKAINELVLIIESND